MVLFCIQKEDYIHLLKNYLLEVIKKYYNDLSFIAKTMTRNASLSPLKQWEEEEKHNKIGLVTLYRLQNDTYNFAPQHAISRFPNSEAKVESVVPRQRQNRIAGQQMDNIFSHRSVFDKRKKFQLNQKKKKLGNQSKPVGDKKTLLMKQYSFEEMNQEEVRQNWLRNKIYRDFIASGISHRKTDHSAGNNVLLNLKSSHSSQKKQKKIIYSNRFNTQISEKKRQKQRYMFIAQTDIQNKTINPADRNNGISQAQFCNKGKKYFHRKNTNNFRDYFRKNKSKGPKNIDLDNYSSNLLTSSLQNMPCQAINEVNGSTPRPDRIKDTIRQYLKSIERRSFTKKITILQSI